MCHLSPLFAPWSVPYCWMWPLLWTNTQWIPDKLMLSPSFLTVSMKRHRPVLGHKENICALSHPCGTGQSRSSTKWCMATRMYAPWVTTRAWTGRPRTPSSGLPSIGDVSDDRFSSRSHSCQCWSQSCWSIFPRNSMNRSFTWAEQKSVWDCVRTA